MMDIVSDLEFTTPLREAEVLNGIPRFVPNQSYSENFGEQWHLFQKTQLDSYSQLPISERRLNRCLGPELWNDLENKLVLECGCGAGRFTEVLLNKKARVASVDLSSAVEINAKNFPLDQNHLVLQADILKLPFQPAQFDIVLCLGVLQHTPQPAETLKKLYEQVKPGGHLIVDQYIFNQSYWSLRLAYRQIFKRLQPQVSFRILRTLSRVFLPLHRATRGSRLLSLILNRVSPMVTYYRAFPEMNNTLQKEWALLDTFDTLTDWYKNFGSVDSLRTNLRVAGFKNIKCTKDGNGIEARAQRV
jgi:2-polyprenyl-3-methyl-5-hydroxy-6-metoxy-1,4-benzoquinol methylase